MIDDVNSVKIDLATFIKRSDIFEVNANRFDIRVILNDMQTLVERINRKIGTVTSILNNPTISDKSRKELLELELLDEDLDPITNLQKALYDIKSKFEKEFEVKTGMNVGLASLFD